MSLILWGLGLAVVATMATPPAKAASVPQAPAGPPLAPPSGWDDALPLPTAADVQGFDLLTNWGATPESLRPLFALVEIKSRIAGAARFLALAARRESAFVLTAHNKSSGERTASANAYSNNKAKRPPLVYGAAAAAWGSGGLFGLLGPYFLWTGIQELGGAAPLLGSPPEIMFLPRVAAFAGAVYMQRILANYRVDDVADIKVGWASPSLLGNGRGGATYKKVRARFLEDSAKLGIKLNAPPTLPPKLSAAAWPGVAAVFEGVVGTPPRLA
ncbi:hypothetical protein [Nannocystis bainbridge]|uniref:Uncharacterized protein n=1 Tax=Nannocystis bainbridge TaxID=2995303 RepID=A0ABT5E5G3_9BACT|nr:hypothetical protein [Nannocystis bainbridge]MDC0720673.1 hypothetical protein [Nannocystis bainbridge]